MRTWMGIHARARRAAWGFPALVAVSLAGCGGGGSSPPPAYSIGGTISGLSGTVVLRNNGGNTVAVSANGAFTFSAPLGSGGTYDVSVVTQPSDPRQTCAISNGTGAVASANVTNVAVVCTTNIYTIGLTVSGLSGTGLVLQNNGGNHLPVNANGSATFATPIASGATYEVSVLVQPSGLSQTCLVSKGAGRVGGNNVSNIDVTCTTDKFTVGGSVAGLLGAGLVLRRDDGNNVVAAVDAEFTFSAALVDGSPFAVSVLNQPSGPSQTCTVSNGSGILAGRNVGDVAVNCTTNTYTIGGAVNGLVGAGLVLRSRSGGDIAVGVDGAFAFAQASPSGGAYEVTVLTQPTNPSQTCTVGNGTGTVGGARVANVTVSCTTNTHAIGVTVNGLAGAGLVLQYNGGNDLPINGNGAINFSKRIASGQLFSVTVLEQPRGPSQTCTVNDGAGRIGDNDVTHVVATCTTNRFTIGGTVAGLQGRGLVLQSSGGNDLPINVGGAFTFTSAIDSGRPYAVTVLTQPTGPSQTCTVTGGGSGTVAQANVTNVALSCRTDKFTVGGTVTGLTGSGMEVQLNAGNGQAMRASSANGSFAFSSPIESGTIYAVTVVTQPTGPSQTCSVTDGGSGTVADANVTNVALTCTTNTFTIGGTVSGLQGAGLMLRNGINNLSVSASGAFTFTAPVASGAPYAVTVPTQPSGPSQTCSVIGGGSGTVGASNVTNVAVTCATNTFIIGGTVSGLQGAGLVLRNNGANNLSVGANGAFTFSSPIASGTSYAVTVLTQPSAPSQNCTVNGGTGNVGGANVNNVSVNCAYVNPNPPTLTSSVASAYVGQSIRFEGVSTDPNNLPLTYLWDFGDGAGASGSVATHVYTSAGTYSVKLTVFNSGGGTASGTFSQGVVSTVANAFVPDCTGPNCAASGPNTYTGSGTGVWRYSNLTTGATAINLNIGGVSQGKTVTLLFSNGNSTAAPGLPDPGILAIPLAAPTAAPQQPSAVPAVASLQDRHDAAHSLLLAENDKVARSLFGRRNSSMGLANRGVAPLQPMAAPALNTARVWNDLFVLAAPAPYPTTVRAVCPASNGRNVVIWLDPNAQTSGKVTASNITAFADTFCGNNGAFSRLTALLGDAWGSGAAGDANLIQDAPLQDVNIVILDVPATTGWGGYFYGVNNYRSTVYPGSNEALAFFVNADSVKIDLNYMLSALVHEATHMINFYQRSVVLGATHDTWLEETTAMMSEDIVSPTVIKNADGSGHNTVAQARLPAYLGTGGAVSYINWPLLSGPNYAIGGSFGAYINRRYGLPIYRQLVAGCSIGSNPGNSYACFDTLVKNNGGLSFADEFAHFGATVFAALPATGMPAGYGYPAKTDGGYALIPIDLSGLAPQRPSPATALGAGYTAATHTYQIDTIPAGKTTYVRNGVVVPANTTLLVVVR